MHWSNTSILMSLGVVTTVGALAQDFRSTGSIACRVINGYLQAPVPEADVVLTSPTGVRIATKTNSEGLAVFSPDGGGRWVATASMEGFLPVRADASYPFGPGQVLQVQRGELLNKCELSLRPLGSISGRVVTREEKAVKGAAIVALRQGLDSGDPTFVFAGQAASFEDGSFALVGLVPGVYVLRADIPRANNSRQPTRTTYYPSAEDLRSASPVTIRAGMDARGLKIRLGNASFGDVTLRVTSSTTSLSPDQEVTVMRGVNDLNRISYTGDCCVKQRLVEGRITLKQIPVGAFEFQVSSEVDGVQLEGRSSITISEKAPAYANVVVSPLLSVAAKIVRGSEPVPPGKTPTWFLRPLNDITQGIHRGEIESGGGKVRFDDIKPGRFRVTAEGIAPSEYVEAEVDGRPVDGDDIEIPATPVSLVLRVKVGAASLDVQPEGKDGCVGVTLVVFHRRGPRAVFAGKADPFDCTFSAGGLKPGDYQSALVRALQEGEAFDPALRSKLSRLTDVALESAQSSR